MSLSDLTWSAAIDRLAVYAAMEDAQLAHNCETVVRAEIERLRASLAAYEDALRAIEIEAVREGGNWIHMRRNIAVQARAARAFITKHGGEA